MRAYTHADFAGAVGETFELEVSDEKLKLVLETAEELPASVRPEGSFRLEFRGPYTPILPQAIYELTRDGQSWTIFFVPIGRDDSGTIYEAVFN